MKKIILLIFIIGAAFVTLVTLTPILPNLWNVTTGQGFIIPDESSVFTFEVTRLNEGSGEWWLYGKDNRNYYHFIGSRALKYISFPKKSANRCPGFNPEDASTWCKEFIVEVR